MGKGMDNEAMKKMSFTDKMKYINDLDMMKKRIKVSKEQKQRKEEIDFNKDAEEVTIEVNTSCDICGVEADYIIKEEGLDVRRCNVHFKSGEYGDWSEMDDDDDSSDDED